MAANNSLQRALNYAPTDAPLGTEPILAEWLKREFFNIYLSQKSLLLLEPQHSEPSVPSVGLITYADGINWNPGGGEGPYVYTSTGWQKMI
jgi:hypothetical protein